MKIVRGTNGTLVSTTYEEQLFELASRCAVWQRDTAKNPDGHEYFKIQIQEYGNTANIEFDFPLDKTQTANGYEFTASEYLTGAGFTPGTDGAIAVTTTLGYFYKLLIAAQFAEAPLSSTNVDRISGIHNTNDHSFSGSIEFETTQQVGASGQLCTFIKPYLPDPAPDPTPDPTP